MVAAKAKQSLKKSGSYHHGNLKEALVRAAMARIAKSRDFDFKLRDLAQDCGVSLAASYRHFDSKRALLIRIATEGFEELARQQAAAAPAKLPPAEALSRIGEAYIRFAMSFPTHFLVMFHPSLSNRAEDPALLAAAMSSGEKVGAAVERMLAEQGRKDSREASRLSFRAWSAAHGYASLLVAHNPLPDRPIYRGVQDPDAIKAYVDAIVSGIFGER
ncbi:MAG TPA: TetR/AcrR family transcriptional regulator [Bdellovibrionota bacterium]|nr:TetR/AcrR family transcriptional regulator [Bdellovibrionota bacterium]